jgi:hypothetical protein
MYTAICADGRVLPPVIFTSDTKLLDLDFSPGIVVLLPGCKGESNRSTLAWLDQIQEFLQDEPLLLMDNHFSHHHPLFIDTLESLTVNPLYFPPKCGSLLSPLDNSFHAELQKRYFAKPRRSHEEQIRSMIQAYFEISEDSIQKYWVHCGILSKTPPSRTAARLLSEGYFREDSRDAKQMVQLFFRWKEGRRIKRETARNPEIIAWCEKAGVVFSSSKQKKANKTFV